MKPSMLISLLLLLSLLIIHRTQGMGLIRKGCTLTNCHQLLSHKSLEEKSDKDILVEEVNTVWKSKHFSGRARKLMITSSIPTSATVAKIETNKNKENTAEQRLAAADETYPGILDIAGMDYSQARRKPPIHN